MFSKKPVDTPRTTGGADTLPANPNSTFSVIGSDVSIKGDVSASADLHVDGAIEGDIKCSSLVQGETSQINGSIEAESARLSGKVNGSISARELVILKSARIDGDVHYDALTIEQGAQVEGRFSPKAKARSKQAAQATEGNPGEGEPKLSLAG